MRLMCIPMTPKFHEPRTQPLSRQRRIPAMKVSLFESHHCMSACLHTCLHTCCQRLTSLLNHHPSLPILGWLHRICTSRGPTFQQNTPTRVHIRQVEGLERRAHIVCTCLRLPATHADTDTPLRKNITLKLHENSFEAHDCVPSTCRACTAYRQDLAPSQTHGSQILIGKPPVSSERFTRTRATCAAVWGSSPKGPRCLSQTEEDSQLGRQSEKAGMGISLPLSVLPSFPPSLLPCFPASLLHRLFMHRTCLHALDV